MKKGDKTQVVLIDKNDHIIGYQDKLEAHRNPVPLHRAISVVIFDKSGKKILLQKRARDKPTWPLFWSNTTCTHPYPDEDYKKAAERRLKEEMGFAVPLKEVFRFVYEAKYDETWGEHEYDATFVGNYEGKVIPNPEEIDDFEWVDIRKLKKDMKENPAKYTPWFKIIFAKLFK